DRRPAARLANEAASAGSLELAAGGTMPLDDLGDGHGGIVRLKPSSRGDTPLEGCLCNAYAMSKAEGLTLGEAARALGVSEDTLRRWDRAGKLVTVRDEANRRRVPRSEIERHGAA